MSHVLSRPALVLVRSGVVLAVAAAGLLVASPALAADPATDFSYTLSGSTATITGYLGTSTDVDIPSTILDGGTTYTVTAIGAAAFRGNFLPARLTSVVIPDTVTTIGDNAFRFDVLTSLVIPDSVTTIGTYAFYNNVLTSVTLGSSLTTLGNNSFRANSLTTLTIPASVTSIGNNTFAENAMTSVIFDGSAPTTFTAAGANGTFAGDGPVLYYYAGAVGFTSPWKGYVTREISAAESELVITPTGSIVADGTETATATVTVRDDTETPVANVPVAFSVPAGATASAAQCITDVDGTCAITITATTAGTYAIGATVGSDPSALSTDLTFTAVPVPSDTGNPAGQPAADPALAATGADVQGPVVIAVSVLAVGVALLGAARFRRRSVRLHHGDAGSKASAR